MEFSALNDRFRFMASRTTQDPEKLVLPSILFINTQHPAFDELRHRGFLIAIGWWDFSIKIGFLY